MKLKVDLIYIVIGFILIISAIIYIVHDNQENNDLEFNWTYAQEPTENDFIDKNDWNEYIEMRKRQKIKQNAFEVEDNNK